ncbi:MAG TPA: ribosome silencing factor [Polyangium sp.]|nr:ribosome silencing factor [Polyangium sp.]
MVTKKRSEDEGQTPGPAKRTTKKAASKRTGEAKEPRRAVEAAVSTGTKKTGRPKLRASHANASEGGRGTGGAVRRTTIGRSSASGANARGPAVRKAPLASPKRTQPRKAPPETPSAARQLALDIAAAGLEKKAVNCELIDVRGRVDYADFLVIMTGRSDRHVASIAQGIEEELGKKKMAPISIEGMTAAVWVLIDYGDVVVHVFQEDARQLYDIEGLWMDAGRVTMPAEPGQTASRLAAPKPEESAETSDEEDESDDVDDV